MWITTDYSNLIQMSIDGGEKVRFSKMLSELMAKNAETKYQLAKDLGVSQSTIANWLDGSAKPQLRYAAKLAEHYGITVEAVMKGVE